MIASINKGEIQMVHVHQLQEGRDNQITRLAARISFVNVVNELQREIYAHNDLGYTSIEVCRYSGSIENFRFWNRDGSFNIPAYWYNEILQMLLSNGFNVFNEDDFILLTFDDEVIVDWGKEPSMFLNDIKRIWNSLFVS